MRKRHHENERIQLTLQVIWLDIFIDCVMAETKQYISIQVKHTQHKSQILKFIQPVPWNTFWFNWIISHFRTLTNRSVYLIDSFAVCIIHEDWNAEGCITVGTFSASSCHCLAGNHKFMRKDVYVVNYIMSFRCTCTQNMLWCDLIIFIFVFFK